MSATVSFRDIIAMLEECAPGHTRTLATHSYKIQYNGRTYGALPKFDNIEKGHVRKMARHLGILDCAKKQGVA